MDIIKSKILWIAIEATGAEPSLHDIIRLQFSIDIDGEVKEGWDLKMGPISPEGNIEIERLTIYRRTLEDIRAFPKAVDQLLELMSVLDKFVDQSNLQDKFVVAGFNVRSQFEMLKAMFQKTDLAFFSRYFHTPTLDVQSMVAEAIAHYRAPYGARNYQLDTLAEYFEIYPDPHPHDMIELTATRELYKILAANRAKLEVTPLDPKAGAQ